MGIWDDNYLDLDVLFVFLTGLRKEGRVLDLMLSGLVLSCEKRVCSILDGKKVVPSIETGNLDISYGGGIAASYSLTSLPKSGFLK